MKFAVDCQENNAIERRADSRDRGADEFPQRPLHGALQTLVGQVAGRPAAALAACCSAAALAAGIALLAGTATAIAQDSRVTAVPVTGMDATSWLCVLDEGNLSPSESLRQSEADRGADVGVGLCRESLASGTPAQPPAPPVPGLGATSDTAPAGGDFLTSADLSLTGHVDIPDAALRRAVEQALGKETDQPISPVDMAGLTSLSARGAGIADLSGLELAVRLEHLDLYGNDVSDITPLAGLSSLEMLSLAHNRIRDDAFPTLSQLTGLQVLSLAGNVLDDLSQWQFDFPRLRVLDLASTSVDGDDLGWLVSGLPHHLIEGLYLGGNDIQDVTALSSLMNLKWLLLDRNSIEDIAPLSALIELRALSLEGNAVGDLSPLAGMSALETLDLGNNSIDDISALAGLTGLKALVLGENPVNDISVLAGLTRLQELVLSRMGITDADLPVLAGLTGLVKLYLQGNAIEELSSLTGLLGLTVLDLSNNAVEDILPLVRNDGLAHGDSVVLSGNPLSPEARNFHIPDLRARDVVVEFDGGAQVGNPEDRAALMALYNATDGPNWTRNANWGSSLPLDQWYGVGVDGNGGVTLLSLPANQLSGQIPAELANLANLTELDLSGNQLTGSIPAELGQFASLVVLNLDDNQLTGPIPPQLGNLANLRFLNLSGNELSGSIPPELGALAGLDAISLDGNLLTGCIPTGLQGVMQGDLSMLGLPNCGTIASDRAALVALYNATNGPNWTRKENWLTDAPLGEWYGVETDSSGRVDDLDLGAFYDRGWRRMGLAGPIPAELGTLTRLTQLRLDGNALTGPIPPELGNLTSLWRLWLSNNALTGVVPPELGYLSRLLDLRLDSTELTGPIPESFLQLGRLNRFHNFTRAGLCVPGASVFVEWFGRLTTHDGPEAFCNAKDVAVLTALYEDTGGSGWTESSGWLGEGALGEWYGVTVDSLGHVVALDLSRNGLAGQLPLNLGDLSRITTLRVDGNDLTGRLPLSLTWTSLSEFRYSGTDLCMPGEEAFRAWLNTVPTNESTGSECAPLSDLDILEALYRATEGPNWGNRNGWLTDAPLAAWYGVDTDATGSVTSVNLYGNQLTGQIPPEVGNLASLQQLNVANNALTGPIPRELGNLASLQWLDVASNALTGSIPAELGKLTNLTRLALHFNDLAGQIPPELGNLANLQQVTVSSNNLTGLIPPEIGRMSSLQEMDLSHNSGMEGAVPVELTTLRNLEELLAAGTGLCAPTDPDFQTWLMRVHKQRIRACRVGELPAAYLTQAVQSREFPVPLIAGEKALLRAFPTAGRASSAGIPAMRARFYRDGRETHVVDLPGKSTPIPAEVDEGSLATSASVEIAGDVLQPGLEMVIEIDPDGTLDAELGVPKRIPEEGRMAVDVRAMPLFDLTLIPYVWNETGDASIVDLIEAMAAEPDSHEMLEHTRTLLPVGELAATAHALVRVDSNDSFELLSTTEMIRTMEGGQGHYMGLTN